MEYHVEHHMFPMVPSYNLKKLQYEIGDQLPKPFKGLYKFYKAVLPSVNFPYFPIILTLI